MEPVPTFRKRELFAPASDRRPPEMGAAGQDSRITGLGVNPATGPGSLRRRRRGTAPPDASATATAGQSPPMAVTEAPSPTAGAMSVSIEMDPAMRNVLLESLSREGGKAITRTTARQQLDAGHYNRDKSETSPRHEFNV